MPTQVTAIYFAAEVVAAAAVIVVVQPADVDYHQQH